MSIKEANTDFEIHPLLKKRWSPRAFNDKAVTKEQLQRIFEAARWAPSGFNQQPWKFILGMKGDETYQKIFDCLVAFNQLWAGNAPVLILSCGRKVMNDREDINPSYHYDVGQAVAHMSIQAMNEGLHMHQMGGFEKDVAVRKFNIPATYKPLTVISLGYIGNPAMLPERMQKSEKAERDRFPAKSFLYSEVFGKDTDLL